MRSLCDVCGKEYDKSHFDLEIHTYNKWDRYNCCCESCLRQVLQKEKIIMPYDKAYNRKQKQLKEISFILSVIALGIAIVALII